MASWQKAIGIRKEAQRRRTDIFLSSTLTEMLYILCVKSCLYQPAKGPIFSFSK